MELKNTSQYDTVTLRRIITATYDGVLEWRRTTALTNRDTVTQWWEGLTVTAVRGRGSTLKRGKTLAGGNKEIELRLPRLKGDEFIVHLRERHGGGTSKRPYSALKAEAVALIFQQTMYQFFGWKRKRGFGAELVAGVRLQLQRAGVPAFVPLRIRRARTTAEKEPRNIVQERYAKVCELEAKWQRKAKLAQTKLKKLRSKRKHYEKKLNLSPTRGNTQ